MICHLLIFFLILTTLGRCGERYSLALNGREASFDEANYACRRRLPDGQSSHETLVAFLERERLKSVWLSWRQYELDSWKWINGSKDMPPVDHGTFAENLCGTLEAAAPAYLSSASCKFALPCICQFRGWYCWETYSVSQCTHVRNSSFLIGPRQRGWFTARAFCRHLGGDLAVLNQFTISHLSRFIEVNARTDASEPFWVGLRKNMQDTPYASDYEGMETNQWDLDEPWYLGTNVVLQSNGFWRAVASNEKHSVVCITEGANAGDRIIFPKQTTYRSVTKHTFTFMKSNGLYLKDRNNTCNHHTLLEKEVYSQLYYNMVQANITNVWYPVNQVQLGNWTWMNMEELVLPWNPEDTGTGNYATLDHLFSSLHKIPADRHGLGYICEYTDGRPCWKTYDPYSCIMIGGHAFVSKTFCYSWFEARSLCQQLGASLAVVDTPHKISELLKFYKTRNSKREPLNSKDFFYVGLRKQDWLPLVREDFHNKENLVAPDHLWSHDEPKAGSKCAVITREGKNFTLKAAGCNETYYLACVQAYEETSTCAYLSTERQLKETTFHTDGSTMIDENSKHVLGITAAMALPVIVMSTVCICICIYRKRKKLKQSYRARQQTSVPSFSTNDQEGRAVWNGREASVETYLLPLFQWTSDFAPNPPR